MFAIIALGSGWNRYNTRKRIQLTRCKVLQHSSRVRSLMAEDAVTVGVVAAALFDLVNCCCSGPSAIGRRRRRQQGQVVWWWSATTAAAADPGQSQ